MVTTLQKNPISAVIITLNEESNIVRCLSSLDFVDEVVIYDSGSQDRTIELAQALGLFTASKIKLKVIQGKWLGFGPTKNKATAAATHSWILSLDADETVSDELKQEIKSLSLNPQQSFLIPRRSFYLKRWINYGGWYPDFQLRFFNKDHWQWNGAVIHEKVECRSGQGQTQNLLNPLHHFVFKNIEHHVQTNNRYSSLQAEKLFKDGKRYNSFHCLTKPWVKFVECYFFKLGLFDGWPGFVIAVNAGHSVFLKWTKLAEIERNQLAELERNQLAELEQNTTNKTGMRS